MPSSIHVRRLDDALLRGLKREARAQDTSVNQLVLQLLERGLGLSRRHPPPLYHDLDPLAGTWSKRDSAQFARGVAAFEKIDEELWK